MPVTYALRLLGFALGAALSSLLFLLLAWRREKRWFEWATLAALGLAGFWHLAGLARSMSFAVLGERIEKDFEVGPLLVRGVAGAVVVLFAALARRAAGPVDRRFLLMLAISFGVVLAGTWSDPNSATAVFTSLAPLVCFAAFVYRYNVLDLLIRRRWVFTIALTCVSAVYLLTVKIVADFAEFNIGAFGPLLEVILILAASVLWLPLYGWITRVMNRRNQVIADFGRRVIDEAVRILDLRDRLQFLADGIAKAFKLRRAVIAIAGDDLFEKVESMVRAERHSLIHLRGAESGFSYLFPLWHEDQLTGVLFVDSSFLDENETILAGLTGQISQSIEACRLASALAEKERLATLGLLSNKIAHEVRNPLAPIRALAQIIREDPEAGPRFSDELNLIISETDRLNRLVRQLLTYGRPAPEGAAPEPALPTLEQVAQILAVSGRDRRVRVETRFDPQLSQRYTDRQCLEQVALNLGMNAIQASAEDGCVLVNAESLPDGAIQLEVTDAGPGVPADLQRKIFEPFFTTNKVNGTGLGLAIVHQNIKHLGGKITLKSPAEGGRGAAFRVVIPQAVRAMLLVLGFLVPAQSAIAPKETLDRMRRVMDAIYSLEYDGAAALSKEMITAAPDDPAGYVMLARTDWAEQLSAERALTIDRFASSDFFSGTSRYRVQPDPAAELRFRELSEQAIAKAKARLARKPSDAWSKYLLGVAYQNQASYDYSLRHDFWSAYKRGSAALRQHKELLRADPEFVDPRLSTGVASYVAASVPWSVRWLTSILGTPGSKERGTVDLELVAEKGQLVADDAKTILIVFYTRERKYEKALAKLEELSRKYPKNYLAHLERGGVALRLKRPDRALAIYKEILGKVEGRRDGYDRLEKGMVYNRLGVALRVQGDAPGAAEWFRRALAEKPVSQRSRTIAELELGKTLDLLGKREEAQRLYESVRKAADVAGSRREAEQLLSRPYQAD